MKKLQTNNEKWFGQGITFVDNIELKFDGNGKTQELETELANKILKEYEGLVFPEGKLPKEETPEASDFDNSEDKEKIEELKGEILSKESIIKDYKEDLVKSKEETESWKKEFEKASNKEELENALKEAKEAKESMVELEDTNKKLIEESESKNYEIELLRTSKNDLKKLCTGLECTEEEMKDKGGKFLSSEELVDLILKKS